ncbi:cellulose binding domain-containing protein [Micromonospora sp. NPDC048871]|uniref:cellulose binding domain-containing protein n=1 Tax=Micromonospora sp. NPDC048871 TaxID=3364259 RepID=UPI0037210ABC
MSGVRRAPRSMPSPGATAVASSPWILISIGVGAMVVLLVIAVGAYRGPGADYDPTPPLGAVPPPRATSAGWGASGLPSQPVPGLSPRRTDPPTPTGTAAMPAPEPEPSAGQPSRSAAPTYAAPEVSSPPIARPPATPASPIQARYRVTDTFDGGFIAELSIRNTSRRDQEWVARVEYPGGRVVTAWLEGVPQGTFRDSGGTLTYRSGPDLAAGAAVALRFHIEFASPRPARCVVSGRTCDGL